MAANALFPTALPTRKGFVFYDPSAPVNTYTTPLNPLTVKRTPGNVRKWTQTTNGTAVIMGQTEYPPKMIALEWPQLDKAAFDSIRAFCDISPCVMVDNNDQGYLGVLVCDAPEQLANIGSFVYHAQFSFLVIAPYDGINTTINRLAVPALNTNTATTGGYITANATVYLCATVVTRWGESMPGPVSGITVSGSTSTNVINVSFSAPSSGYYKKLRLYWNNTNSAATSTWLTDIWAGQTASFPIYLPYTQFNSLTPPAYGRNFTGNWQGSIWANGT